MEENRVEYQLETKAHGLDPRLERKRARPQKNLDESLAEIRAHDLNRRLEDLVDRRQSLKTNEGSVHVWNLDRDCLLHELMDVFSRAGEIDSVNVLGPTTEEEKACSDPSPPDREEAR